MVDVGESFFERNKAANDEIKEEQKMTALERR